MTALVPWAAELAAAKAAVDWAYGMSVTAIPRRAVRLITAVSMTVAFVACDAWSNNPPPTGPKEVNVAGAYRLWSMGPNEPMSNCWLSAGAGCTIPNTDDTVVVRGGTLELARNGTFKLNITGTSGGFDGTVFGATGTYTHSGITNTQSGIQVTFTVPNAPEPLVGRYWPAGGITVTIPAAAVGASQGDLFAGFVIW